MDLKELLVLFRRRAWLLALGLLVGLLGGYFASYYMEPIYEASSKLMISREVQEVNSDFVGLNSQQLVQTYIQILKAAPLMNTTSERVEIEINPKQISVQQMLDTLIIEIKVEDTNPERAALIANTMIMVLIELNEEMQASQYVTFDSQIAEQVQYAENQINALQSEYDQAYELDYQDQINNVNEQISSIRTEISTLQAEIEVLHPTRQADRVLAAEKQARVAQLQSMFVIYEQFHANMLILGRPSQYGTSEVSPPIRQLQSTIDLYQGLYLTYIENMEKFSL